MQFENDVQKGQLDNVKHFISVNPALLHYQFLFTDNKGTPLVRAAWYGQLEMVKYLIEMGANIHEHTEYGLTSLMCAASYAHHAVVAYLLQQPGIEVNATDYFGCTALHRVVEGPSSSNFPNYCKTVSLLLKHGAHPNLRNKDGKTVLDIYKHTLDDDQEAIFFQLLKAAGAKKGSDINTLSKEGMFKLKPKDLGIGTGKQPHCISCAII